MTLSSFLLGGSSSSARGGKAQKIVDKELDALFRSTIPSVQTLPAVVSPSPKVARGIGTKRKAGESSSTCTDELLQLGDRQHDVKTKRTRVADAKEEKRQKSKDSIAGRTKNEVSRATGKGKANKLDVCNDHDNDGRKHAEMADLTDSNGSDTEFDPAQLVHESLSVSNKKGKSSRQGARAKCYLAEDTPEQRDSRTIFVGNLPLDVARKRPLRKQLQRHILAQVASAKIESIRFRSIPFQNPTSSLSSTENGAAPVKQPKDKPQNDLSPIKQLRTHDRDRISSWRERKQENDDGQNNDQKSFLTPQQKRKIAFIQQEFHANADTVNAYIVFAHPPDTEIRPSNLPPLPPIMDPYEAAKVAVNKCDGTVFMGRMIRVDHVVNHTSSGDKHSGGDGDPKLSIFVGNLDFASTEEDLRIFFEGVISAERGPPTGNDGGDDEDEDDRRGVGGNAWVTRVRVVRDKDTQLGKGFAYVQFSDRECVDEVLGLETGKLKFAKRKLRIQRCKTITGGSSTSMPRITAGTVKQLPTTPVLPKGDPTLGEKLAHLTKEDRKKYKSADADRVARRLAKKKARMALEKGGLRPQVKDRERTRKTSAMKKNVMFAPKEIKRRVRSDKSMAKQNTKK